MKETKDLKMKDTLAVDDTPFTPSDEKQLIEDCQKFSDDALSILERWSKGQGHIVYPLIIDAMKKIGDGLMAYEEHHLGLAMQKLRQGVTDA